MSRKTAIVDVRNVHAGSVISDVGGYYDGQSIVCPQGSVRRLTVLSLLIEGNTLTQATIIPPIPPFQDAISLVYHHSHNHEGGPGLRLYHAYSTDSGKTWTKETPIEDR